MKVFCIAVLMLVGILYVGMIYDWWEDKRAARKAVDQD